MRFYRPQANQFTFLFTNDLEELLVVFSLYYLHIKLSE